jgi:hypothetical protein
MRRDAGGPPAGEVAEKRGRHVFYIGLATDFDGTPATEGRVGAQAVPRDRAAAGPWAMSSNSSASSCRSSSTRAPAGREQGERARRSAGRDEHLAAQYRGHWRRRERSRLSRYASGLAVAVANALPMLKDNADVVTRAGRGQGVLEIMNAIARDAELLPPRADVALGGRDNREFRTMDHQ